jgi:hypothetical protein
VKARALALLCLIACGKPSQKRDDARAPASGDAVTLDASVDVATAVVDAGVDAQSGYGVGPYPEPAPGQPRVTLGTPAIVGAIDKTIVRRYMHRHISKFQYCYDKQLLDRPALTGTVTLRFEITRSGELTKPSVDGVPAIKECFTRALDKIRFPHDSGPAQITVPLTLR